MRAKFSKQAMQTITDIGTLIVSTPGTCGGRPRIAGHRITVHNIAIDFNAGMKPEEIVVRNNKIYQRSVDDESAKIAKIRQHKIFWRSLLRF